MAKRPLLICDCDEVLLHFVSPFTDYLQSVHDLTLTMSSFALTGNVRRADGEAIAATEFPALLDGFFDTHMPTQTPTPGAVQALATLSAHADIVILTNLRDHHAAERMQELSGLGMPYRVIGNQGPKGKPVAALVAEYGAKDIVFVDDLPPHHSSVKAEAPHVHRLHMVADPILWPLIPPAADAHARIDRWDEALPHIRSILGV
ncbi:MAG: HAD family hydrolase [Polymorphobacter sp.]